MAIIQKEFHHYFHPHHTTKNIRNNSEQQARLQGDDEKQYGSGKGNIIIYGSFFLIAVSE